MKALVAGCVFLCVIMAVNSFRPVPGHENDCYHPRYNKLIQVGETIQIGHCSIATCKEAPFDIDETLCECESRTINYKSGCFMVDTDNSKDYPACCQRPKLCVENIKQMMKK